MIIETDNYEQTDEEKRYWDTWQYIRRWEVRLGVVFFTSMFVAFVNFFFLNSAYVVHIAGTFLVAMGAVAAYIKPICPRCGKEFFRAALLRDGTLKNKCVHCGLLKGAPRDPDRNT